VYNIAKTDSVMDKITEANEIYSIILSAFGSISVSIYATNAIMVLPNKLRSHQKCGEL
jgi:hypothetical protein